MIEYVTHWRTRDGELLLPSEMETGHLLNSLNMMARRTRWFLIRRALRLYNEAFDQELHDMAALARRTANNAYDNDHCRALAIKVWPIAEAMEREYLRRTRNTKIYGWAPHHNPYGED